MNLALGFILALLLTMVMLPLLIRFGPILGLLDQPGARKMHADAIPRSGGLAIVIGFCGAVWFLLPLHSHWFSLYAGALIIVIFALLDDRRGLSYQWKFVGQIAGVLVLMKGGVLIEQLPFAPVHYTLPWLSYLITFFFLLGSINAVNLSDGLDGLAAGISLLSLCLLALLAYQSGQSSLALLATALIGGLLGFLRYNTFPARVFLGDTGSQFIGLMIASLAILITQSPKSAFSPLLPLLLLGMPILDTVTVMAIRIYRGRSPFAADNKHIHHQLLALGLYHYEVVASLYLLQIMMVSATYLLRFQSDGLFLACYGVFAASLIGLIYLARSRGMTVRAPVNRVGIEQRNHFLRRFNWFYHHSTVLLQWALALFFLQVFLYVEGIDNSLAQLAAWVAAGLIVVGLVLRKYPLMACRIIAYVASITLVYLMASATGELYSHWFVDGYLMVMVIMLALAIRMTRKTDFRLDTRDVLVLFLVLALPQLPVANLSEGSLSWAVLRLAVLFYACEYVLNKRDCNYWLLSGSAIVGIILVAWFR